jgi:hypothetical protein
VKNLKKQAAVFSLATLLYCCSNLQAAQAAPNDNQEHQQREDQQRREQQQRLDQQRREEQQRQEQQLRQDQQQRQDQQRQDYERQEQQRQEYQRQEQQRQEYQRREQQRPEYLRPDYPRQDNPRHHDWSHAAYNDRNFWYRSDIRANEALPFNWREHHDRYPGERIEDAEWNNRFPGLHSYKWRGDSFWYRGRNIRNCILFYDDSDELVGIGFMEDGAFVFLRDDYERYDNHDSFILLWLISFLL